MRAITTVGETTITALKLDIASWRCESSLFCEGARWDRPKSEHHEHEPGELGDMGAPDDEHQPGELGGTGEHHEQPPKRASRQPGELGAWASILSISRSSCGAGAPHGRPQGEHHEHQPVALWGAPKASITSISGLSCAASRASAG